MNVTLTVPAFSKGDSGFGCPSGRLADLFCVSSDTVPIPKVYLMTSLVTASLVRFSLARQTIGSRHD